MKRAMKVKDIRSLVDRRIPRRGVSLAFLKALGEGYSRRRWLDLPGMDRKKLSTIVSDLRSYGWPIESAWRKDVGAGLVGGVNSGWVFTYPNGPCPSVPRRKLYRFTPQAVREFRAWTWKNRKGLNEVTVAVLKAMRLLVKP